MRIATGVVVSLGFAGPVLADVTAEDVLADQLNLLSGYGLLEMETLETTTRADGLRVTGFRGSHTDEEGDTVTIDFPGVDLIERADGTVSIEYPALVPITINGTGIADDAPRSVTISFDFDDVTHIVSGSGDILTHKITADRIAYAGIAGIPEEEMEDVDVALAFLGLDSTLRFVDGDTEARDLEFSLGRMRFEVTGEELDGTGLNLIP